MAWSYNSAGCWLFSNLNGITVAPITLACWVNYTSTSAFAGGLGYTAGQQFYGLTSTNLAPEYQVVNGGTQPVVNAGVSVNSGTWNHLCGVSYSSSSRRLYVNGVGGGFNGVDVTPSPMDSVIMGAMRTGGGSVGFYWPSLTCMFGIWNVALTDGEILSLAKGRHPKRVRSSNLKLYPDLERSDYPSMITTGEQPTVSGSTPTIVPNPRIYF